MERDRRRRGARRDRAAASPPSWASPRRACATGGAADANTTSALGVPTLDGLGPVGGNDHAPSEYLDLATVTDRVTLLAALVAAVTPGVEG